MSVTKYSVYIGPSPNDRLMAAIFGGQLDPHGVRLSWEWEGRRYEAEIDEDPGLRARWAGIITGPAGSVELIWGRDVYRPRDGRRGILRLTDSGRRKVESAIRREAEAWRLAQEAEDRAFLNRLLAGGVTFDPDGGVRAADGAYDSPDKLRAVLPTLRPWRRAAYVLRAVSAARMGVANADAHLRLVVDTVGLSGQGPLWDTILFGDPVKAGEAFAEAFPGFDPRVVADLLGDDD